MGRGIPPTWPTTACSTTRDTFIVLDAAGDWRRAELYRIVGPEGPFAPAEQYIDWMLEGARVHGLPDDDIARIAGLRGAS